MSQPGPESLPYASPLDLVRAPAAEYDAAGDERMVTRLGACAWLICALLAGGMLVAWPPSHAAGRAGWPIAVAMVAGEGIVAAHVLRRRDFPLAALLMISLGVIAGLGLLDWLSGAGGDYTMLIVLPLVYVAASQSPRRVVASLLVAPMALLPGLAVRHLGSQALASDLVTVVLWLCLAGMALFWTAGVRWQRLALRHSEDRAHHRALHDSVTGLGNHHKLMRDLEMLFAMGTPATLALFDLNGFKAYNDTYGHPAGDALLRRLGAKLAESVDAAGGAYRMGGDEFVVLAGGDAAPEDVLAAGSAALSDFGHGFTVSAAGGTVAVPAEAPTPSDALRVADGRMYAQKYQSRANSPAHGTRMLLALLRERHPDLGTHSDEVTRLAVAVGRRFGLADPALEQLALAAELHDIGKLAVPDAILDKPEPLTDDEWAFISRHTLIGERIVSAAPPLEPVGRVIRASHERMDGTGYPDGLRGDEIPLLARIIAVCDAYDAMTSDRAYRSAVDPVTAVAELRRSAVTGQFDPPVVEVFAAVLLETGVRAGSGGSTVTDGGASVSGADSPRGAVPQPRRSVSPVRVRRASASGAPSARVR